MTTAIQALENIAKMPDYDQDDAHRLRHAAEVALAAIRSQGAIDAVALAKLFHEAYERLAPLFGYETRPDTKAFDPSTPNGKLMIAVCGELLAKLEPSSRLDMLTDEEIEELAAKVYPFDIWLNKDQRGRSTIQRGHHKGFIQGLRFARDRFSAPPAIDVENIMEVVRQWVAGQLGMTPENEHWKDEEWQAAVPDLRSRLLSLLSPGKGEGVTVAENKAPRS